MNHTIADRIITAIFKIETNHPIFFEQPITISAQGNYWENSMGDWKKKITFWSVTKINGKEYNEVLLRSVRGYLEKHYMKQIQERFDDFAD